jgi:hypothetical protein
MKSSGCRNFSVIRWLPSANSSPNPSRYTVASTMRTRASALPKRSGISVSASST